MSPKYIKNSQNSEIKKKKPDFKTRQKFLNCFQRKCMDGK